MPVLTGRSFTSARKPKGCFFWPVIRNFPRKRYGATQATLFCRRRSCAYAKISSECSNGPRKISRNRWRPPVWRRRNVWGGFTFRAYWLTAPDAGGAPPLLGVTVHKQEPLPLRFSRRMDELPLSARECEACLLMLLGHSRATIAEKLGVSRHTAISHCRTIYAKLDVRNRAELVAKVLSK